MASIVHCTDKITNFMIISPPQIGKLLHGIWENIYPITWAQWTIVFGTRKNLQNIPWSSRCCWKWHLTDASESYFWLPWREPGPPLKNPASESSSSLENMVMFEVSLGERIIGGCNSSISQDISILAYSHSFPIEEYD